MTLKELIAELNKLHELMDGRIDGVTNAATEAQDLIYKFILQQLRMFDTRGGYLVTDQNIAARIGAIQRKISEILGDIYRPSISEYLGSYSTVEDSFVSLQKGYNDISVELQKITPARRTAYNQTEFFLTDGLADAYVQPAKYLLMQQVVQGISLKDAERTLRKWNDGELAAGSQLTSGRATHNLNKYATQVSRDSIYGYYGSINKIIADEYDLKGGIYTGNIIEDSRPGCKYLVGLRRTINIDEIPEVIKNYPEGVKPNTTKENFPVVRMGYSCRHGWFSVRIRN